MVDINTNILEMARQHLQHEIASAITNRIVDDEIRRIKPLLKELVRVQAEKVVIPKMETLQTVLNMRNELRVFLKWSDEDEDKEIK